MAERRPDLVSCAGRPWREFSSPDRIQLRAVEIAFVALTRCKLFKQTMQGSGLKDDDFLRGISSLDVLASRIDGLFNGSLTEIGRRKLGLQILTLIDNGHLRREDFTGRGDQFAVKELLNGWVQKDFGVENPISK